MRILNILQWVGCYIFIFTAGTFLFSEFGTAKKYLAVSNASVGFMISIFDYIIFVKKPGPIVFIISIISDEFIPYIELHIFSISGWCAQLAISDLIPQLEAF